MRGSLNALCLAGLVSLWLGASSCTPEQQPQRAEPDAGMQNNGDVPPDEVTPDEDCPCGMLAEGRCVPQDTIDTRPESCPSGRFDADGICEPEPPRMLVECPGERGLEGVCAPLPPVFEGRAACPGGWVQTDVLDEAGSEGLPPLWFCQPDPRFDQCPEGFMASMGALGCVRQGPQCPPEGEAWDDEAALRSRASGFDGAVVYVGDGPSPDGDGTRSRPLASLGEALEIAVDGDLIALAAVEQAEVSEVKARVAILGACVARTSLGAPEGEGLILSGDGVRVDGVTIDGVSLRVESRGVSLAGVRVVGAPEVGLSIGEGAEVSIEGVSVEDTVPLGVEEVAPGMEIGPGAQVDATESVWLRNHGVGILVQEGADFIADRILVADTVVGPCRDACGRGLMIEGAQVALRQSVLTGNRWGGVSAQGQGASLTLEDVVISNTLAAPPIRIGGYGLELGQGAQALLERTALIQNKGGGVRVEGVGTDAVLRDVVVQRSDEMLFVEDSGLGLLVRDGARVEGHRIALVENTLAAAQVQGEGSRLEMEDAVMLDSRPIESSGSMGMGLRVVGGGVAQVDRAVLLRNRDAGIQIVRSGSKAHLSDVRVEATEPNGGTLTSGYGLTVRDGGEVVLARGFFRGNHEMGIKVRTEGTTASLSDVVVLDTQPRASDKERGWGLRVNLGASCVAERLVIQGNRSAGVQVQSDGSRLELSDAYIADTDREENEEDQGWGADLVLGVQASLTRVRLTHNQKVGVRILDAVVSLEDVVIEGTVPPNPTTLFAGGLLVSLGARVEAARIAILGNSGVGVAVSTTGTRLDMSDVRIADGLSMAQSPTVSGWGIVVGLQAEARLRRAAIVNNRRFGVVSAMPGALVVLNDTAIRNTLPDDCDGLCQEGYGTGILVAEQANVEMCRFLIEDNGLIGLQVVRAGSIAAAGGIIARNQIGLNFQSAAVDLDAAFSNVRVVDNDVDYDSSELPLPSALDVVTAVAELD